MLRSSHFFGRLRFRKSEVPEPTLAPTKIVLPPAPGIKGGFGSIHNIFLNFELSKSELSSMSTLDHIYHKKLLLCHVLSQQQGFPFCLAKKMQPEPPEKRRRRLSAPANKKIGSTASSTLKVAAPGGSSSSTLYKNYYYFPLKLLYFSACKLHSLWPIQLLNYLIT